MAQDMRGAFFGSGEIYIADLETPENLIFVQNCSSLTFEAQTEEKTQTDFSNPGGGTYASILRITSVDIAYTAHAFNKINIARALYGNAVDVPAGDVTDEVRVAYKGALCKLDFPNPSAVIVKHSSGAPTYALGTDYTVNEAGLKIPAGSTIENAATIKVSYEYPAHANIQAMVASNKNYRMVFKGLNEARSGKAQIIEVYKMSHSPSSLGLIGDDFGSMDFTGKAQKDVTKTGALISQYLQIQDVD